MNNVKKNYLLYYFTFTYLLSWICWLPFVLKLNAPDILALVGVFSPMIVSVTFTALEKGKNGVKSLLKGLLEWKVNYKWYLFVLFFPFLIIFLGVYFNYALSGSTIEITAIESWTAIPILFISIFTLGGPLGEEFGWRGYALPKLQEEYSSLKSSVILGVLWTFWHSPIFFFSDMHEGFPILVYSLEVIGLSILMTWIFNNTNRSILLAMLLHTSINTAAVIMPIMESYSDQKIPFLFAILILWITDLIIIKKYGPNLKLNYDYREKLKI